MLNVFDKYFIGDGIELNWDYVNSIPEFQKLKECQQTPIWHSEGNAYIHVANCVDEAYKNAVENGAASVLPPSRASAALPASEILSCASFSAA